MSKKQIHLVSVFNAPNIFKAGNVCTIRDVCGSGDDIEMNRRLYRADQFKAGVEGKPAPVELTKKSAKAKHQCVQWRDIGLFVDWRLLHQCTSRGRQQTD